MSVLSIVLGLAALAVVVVLVLYNGLIRRRNAVDQALSGVDVHLKKRFDLIPNLVAAVEAYMGHERDTLTQLTTLRTRALSGDLSGAERAEIDRAVTGALGQLRVAVESYPELKASANFVQLQGALNEVEEQLSAARRAYNAAVTAFNNTIQTVPSSLIAGMLGFTPRTLFAASDVERANVDVGALFGRGG